MLTYCSSNDDIRTFRAVRPSSCRPIGSKDTYHVTIRIPTIHTLVRISIVLGAPGIPLMYEGKIPPWGRTPRGVRVQSVDSLRGFEPEIPEEDGIFSPVSDIGKFFLSSVRPPVEKDTLQVDLSNQRPVQRNDSGSQGTGAA